MRSVRMPPSSTPVTTSGSPSAYVGSAKRSATWTTSLVLTMRPKADVGRCRGTRRRCSRSGGGVLCGSLANSHRVREYGLEDRLQLPGRRRDDLQHFRGRRLLLQRVAELARARLHLVE